MWFSLCFVSFWQRPSPTCASAHVKSYEERSLRQPVRRHLVTCNCGRCLVGVSFRPLTMQRQSSCNAALEISSHTPWCVVHRHRYISYGNDTEKIITLNMPSGPFPNVVKGCLCFSLYFTYPVMMFPVSTMLDKVLSGTTYPDGLPIHKVRGTCRRNPIYLIG